MHKTLKMTNLHRGYEDRLEGYLAGEGGSKEKPIDCRLQVKERMSNCEA